MGQASCQNSKKIFWCFQRWYSREKANCFFNSDCRSSSHKSCCKHNIGRRRVASKIRGSDLLFQVEAGSYGKDTRGLMRQHQFEKVELVNITKPGDSEASLEEMLSHAEMVLKKLELPYRIIQLCTGIWVFPHKKPTTLKYGFLLKIHTVKFPPVVIVAIFRQEE